MLLSRSEVAACQTSLIDFTETTFVANRRVEFIRNAHQIRITDALERVVLGMCPRLIINVPPRSGKTELAVVNFIAWALGLYPDAEFIHASYSGRLAGNNTWNARTLIQSPIYNAIFPAVQLRSDSSARDEFRTTLGGVIYATGSEGALTGYGAGKMRDGFGGAAIIDDANKPGDINYPVKRNRVLDWFKETLESRKNRPDTPIIVIMQRLHEDDLTGFLLAGGNGETWEHIVIPALDDAGQSFWERQFPAEKLRRMEAASSYVFAGQYQQRPAPKGGGMLKSEWFEIVPAAPAGVRWIRAWDLAASKEAESAFTAGVLMGVGKDGTFYVEDVTRLQGSAGEVKRTIAATASQDGRAVHGSIPQDPGAGGKAWAEDLIRAVAGYVYRATPESGDKETRAMPFAAQAEAGNVKLVRGPWNRAYLDELKLFPTGKFKDQVDASSRAFNELAGPVAMAEEQETGFY